MVLLWTLGCVFLFELYFCLGMCPGMGLMNHMATLFLVSWGTFILFSIVAAPLTFPPTGEESSLFSISREACLKWIYTGMLSSHYIPSSYTMLHVNYISLKLREKVKTFQWQNHYQLSFLTGNEKTQENMYQRGKQEYMGTGSWKKDEVGSSVGKAPSARESSGY